MAQPDPFSGRLDEAWLASHVEEILEPGLPIVDPHHHLWVRPGSDYLFPELLADLTSGHAVRATVFEECHSMYRADGPEELRSLGETEFATGVAAMSASGAYGAVRACAGIVGNIDLMLGDRVAPLIERHLASSDGRFAGVRYSTAWHAHPKVHKVAPEPHRLADPRVRAGLACLARKGLTFDAWVYHEQIGEVAEVAAAFPEMPVVLCHFGTPILGGPNANRGAEVFQEWRAAIAALARHPNVAVKLGALPVRRAGPGREAGGKPLTSLEIAEAWRPWIEACVAAFGADRCMFESNFPVQKRWCSYAVFWNACKRLAAGASPAEKRAMFAETASRVYRLPPLFHKPA